MPLQYRCHTHGVIEQRVSEDRSAWTRPRICPAKDDRGKVCGEYLFFVAEGDKLPKGATK
jgi:hypothetical protein